MIKAIIFDCYGVLVGSGYWNVYKQLGGNPIKDKKILDELLDKVNLGLLSNNDFHIETAYRLKISKEQVELALRNDEKPNVDVFSLINELKSKYKLGLLSNGSIEGIRRKIQPDLLTFFDVIVTSAEVKLLKPSPEIFKYTISKLGIFPNEAIFIDDHDEYLKGAEKIGMKTIKFINARKLKSDISLVNN